MFECGRNVNIDADANADHNADADPVPDDNSDANSDSFANARGANECRINGKRRGRIGFLLVRRELCSKSRY